MWNSDHTLSIQGYEQLYFSLFLPSFLPTAKSNIESHLNCITLSIWGSLIQYSHTVSTHICLCMVPHIIIYILLQKHLLKAHVPLSPMKASPSVFFNYYYYYYLFNPKQNFQESV